MIMAMPLLDDDVHEYGDGVDDEGNGEGDGDDDYVG